MTTGLEIDLLEDHLEALHFATDYVPKRAIRFFLEGGEEKIAALVREMEAVLGSPESYREEGSRLVYFGIMILASLHCEEGIRLVQCIGRLPMEAIEAFLGRQFFESFPLAAAELYKYTAKDLKCLIEDPKSNPAVRAALLQAMMILFGQKSLSRADVVSYFKGLLDSRGEKIPYFYEVIAGASFALHPEEMMSSLRQVYREGYLNPAQIQLEEIEEILALPKEQVVEESREMFSSDLKDLIAHLELAYQGKEGPDRNDPCPCGSGAKFKKCCR